MAAADQKRVAVLGAGGFLGSHLTQALVARGDCLVEAYDTTFEKLSHVKSDRLRCVRCRIDTPGLLEDVTSRCATVLSLTALCNPALYNTEPLVVIDANYTDLVPLVKLCANKGRWLVHFSTCEVYGRMALDGSGNPMSMMNEDTTAMFLGPVHRERWTYACAKQLLERVIWAHAQHAGLKFTIIRPFNVIGPRMDFVAGVDGQGVPRVLACFIGALLKGEPMALVDGGKQRRSFMYVDDFVEAIERVLDRPAQCQGEILNVGDPAHNISIRDLALALRAAYTAEYPGAVPPPLHEVTAEEFYGAGYDDSLERLPDIAKARRLLEWEPRTGLDAMLTATLRDYMAHYQPLLARQQKTA